ncbi:C4-dicarboxylate TRAP transporter substrate-binding protein [Pelagibacterium montanilacus]|uniref:C4-dicarboxylate TRAP transporter substrate-binding protein n=1 Tax=Pelagibacterium montanilacus TaxID=2185280 RepID=UPI000F8E9CA0|nr:C4-dicarboxylate TRAP transporter substrate-binding protein [Pelagibacterium montanilacus]
MKHLALKSGLMAAVFTAGMSATAMAEDFTLRIASGHPDVNTYVRLMSEFFVPEVEARVAERTDHTVSFIEGYGGSMVSVSDTLEGVQSGVIDIGGFCFCFEASNLPLHAFQVMLPFGTMSPVESVTLARAVYDQVPELEGTFEQRFGQTLLGLIADNGYNLVTNFEWETVEDLQGQRIAGAGLNLKWLEYAGVVPVQSSLVDAYTSLQTGVYNGWIMFPSGVINFRLYEVADNYAETGFGSITWHGLTMNQNRLNSLPPEVQEIILEVGREYEEMTGTVNEEDYAAQIAELEELGSNVWEISDDVRETWANSLAGWPQEMANELDAAGQPGSQVLNIALDEAEVLGYEWPVRYEID